MFLGTYVFREKSVKAGLFLKLPMAPSARAVGEIFSVEKMEFPLYKNKPFLVNAFLCLYIQQNFFKSCVIWEMECSKFVENSPCFDCLHTSSRAVLCPKPPCQPLAQDGPFPSAVTCVQPGSWHRAEPGLALLAPPQQSHPVLDQEWENQVGSFGLWNKMSRSEEGDGQDASPHTPGSRGVWFARRS